LGGVRTPRTHPLNTSLAPTIPRLLVGRAAVGVGIWVTGSVNRYFGIFGVIGILIFRYFRFFGIFGSSVHRYSGMGDTDVSVFQNTDTDFGISIFLTALQLFHILYLTTLLRILEMEQMNNEYQVATLPHYHDCQIKVFRDRNKTWSLQYFLSHGLD